MHLYSLQCQEDQNTDEQDHTLFSTDTALRACSPVLLWKERKMCDLYVLGEERVGLRGRQGRWKKT